MNSRVVILVSDNTLESIDAVCRTLKVKPNTSGRGKALESLVACAAELVGLRDQFKDRVEQVEALTKLKGDSEDVVDDLNDKVLELEEVNRAFQRLSVYLMNATPNS